MVEGHFRPFLPLDLCGAPSPHRLIHSGLFLRLRCSHCQREVFRFQASSMTALRWPTGKSIRELRIGACAMLSTCPRGPRGGVIGWLVRHVSRNPAFPVGCSKCPCRGPRFWVLGQIAHARQKGVLHRIFVCLIGFRSHHPSKPFHQATSADCCGQRHHTHPQKCAKVNFPMFAKGDLRFRVLLQTCGCPTRGWHVISRSSSRNHCSGPWLRST